MKNTKKKSNLKTKTVTHSFTVNNIPKGVKNIFFRADSGFFQGKLFGFLELNLTLITADNFVNQWMYSN